jgi:hypothetical protein
MLGSQGNRVAARYEANRALFLLLLCAPFRPRFLAGEAHAAKAFSRA